MEIPCQLLIERHPPRFIRAFAAHMLDIFLSILLGVVVLFGISNLYAQFPYAKEAVRIRETTMIESSLFIKKGDNLINIGKYYEDIDLTLNEKSLQISDKLTDFFAFFLPEEWKDATQTYNEMKLEARTSKGEKLFDDQLERRLQNVDYDETYYRFYQNICLNKAPGYLSLKKGYLQARRTLILNQTFAIETSLLIGFLFFYLLFPLLFHRGKQTIGMRLSKIYYLRGDGLSPKANRYLPYILFHYIFFFLLAPAILFIPYFISIGMMAKRDEKQTLSEYVFGFYPVEAESSEIYEKEEEALQKERQIP